MYPLEFAYQWKRNLQVFISHELDNLYFHVFSLADSAKTC